MRASASWIYLLAILLFAPDCQRTGSRGPTSRAASLPPSDAGETSDAAWVPPDAAAPRDDEGAAESPCPIRAQQLTAGKSHACALLTNGTVRCWGSNYRGQLGDGTTTFRSAPVEVQGLDEVLSVAAGERHTCALKRNGTVWCWGSNDLLQLGTTIDPKIVRSSPNAHPHARIPVVVPGVKEVQAIAAGNAHTLAMQQNGVVMYWGSFDDFRKRDVRKPFAIPKLRARHIAAGDSVACAVTESETQCWGLDLRFILGTDAPHPFSMIRVDQANELHALAISSTTLCGIDARGSVHCWGEKARLAIGSKMSAVARNVIAEDLDPAVGLASRGHTCAVLAHGQVACWGENDYSQLGDGTDSYGDRAVRVAGVHAAVEVAVGDTSTCTRTQTGRVFCWGENGYGQLGDATTESRSKPAEVQFCATTSEPIFPAPPPGARIVAALRRDLCHGSCPVYSVRVYDDGTVLYHGDWYVRVRGGRKAKLSMTALDELRAQFRNIDFLNRPVECPIDAKDASRAHLFYREGTRTRLIVDDHSCGPPSKPFRDLEAAMDRIVGTDRWIQPKDSLHFGPVDLEAHDGQFDAHNL